MDDDPKVLKLLETLLRADGQTPVPAGDGPTALTLLAEQSFDLLISDVHMVPMDGMELCRLVRERYPHLPIIVLTAYGTVETARESLRNGAFDFLTKPFHDKDLIEVIREALKKDVRLTSARAERETILRRMQALTPRERQVFDLVIQGLLNKQIGGLLGASEETIKVHRRRVMEKMQVPSVAELVQVAVKADALKPWDTPLRSRDSIPDGQPASPR